MKYRRLLRAANAAWMVLLVAQGAYADPIIIRDGRATDIAVTPALGRGYSLSTNTYLSICLKDVKETRPSYDFDYRFVQGQITEADADSEADDVFGDDDKFVRDTMLENLARAQARGKFVRSLIAKLNIDTYYSSVDEAESPLSDDAQKLLERGDLPGFFASCGSSLVRGITRRATFVGVLSYEATPTPEGAPPEPNDAEFQAALLQIIQSVNPAAVKEGGTASAEQIAFYRRMVDRNLTITLRGWGLGRRDDAALVATTIPEFKHAISEAFKSMQISQTGRVTSIEVVPWSDNTGFQSKLNLASLDTSAGRDVPIHEKKEILMYNTEFLAAINREARTRLTDYYLATVCAERIRHDWFAQGTLDPQKAATVLRNHRRQDGGVTLTQLWTELKQGKLVDELYNDYKEYMYDGSDNVAQCVRELMTSPPRMAAAKPAPKFEEPKPGAAAAKPAPVAEAPKPAEISRGLFLKRYTDIPACVAVEGGVGIALPAAVEEHCLPTPWIGRTRATKGGTS